MFQVFSKIVGIRYLWGTLGPLLNELNEIGKDQNGTNSTRNTQMSLLGNEFDLEVGNSLGMWVNVCRLILRNWKMKVRIL